MDKDFMLNYYDKMVRPTWTELMKTPRYQRAACEHDKLEREFRRLLDEKLGRKYLELDDALFRVMDDIAEAMYGERRPMNAICDTTAKSETLSVKGCKVKITYAPADTDCLDAIQKLLQTTILRTAGHTAA